VLESRLGAARWSAPPYLSASPYLWCDWRMEARCRQQSNARIIMVLAALLTIGALLSACESFVQYTVVNNTGEDLVTWPGTHSCDAAVGTRDDYLASEVVHAHERHDYFANVGASGPNMSCVYVATADRRVVDAEPYVFDGVFTVNEPLNAGTVFPDRNDLPHKSYVDKLRDMTPQGWAMFVFGTISAVAVLAGIGVAGFQLVRSIRRRSSVP
jgi:hypothetical protein